MALVVHLFWAVDLSRDGYSLLSALSSCVFLTFDWLLCAHIDFTVEKTVQRVLEL